MKGIVAKSTGSWYHVRNMDSGNTLMCRTKGKLRLDDSKHTNPVTVGDIIFYEMEPGQETGVISGVEPRRNYVIRKASNLSKQTHILASNMDQAALIVTLAFPMTSLGFIDRFLTTTEAYHIPALLVLNKADLLVGELADVADEVQALYEGIGYPVIRTSAKNNTGIEVLRNRVQQKTTLFCGHSGVGKSTLLNTIDPQLHIKTSEISGYHLKGQHTTTFAEMHPLSMGGYIIDTPGIREFGLVDVQGAEISHYFIEMRPYISQCKFNNCTHTQEPGCAIKEAVKNGAISEQRYQSYLSLYANLDLYA
ncbi:MAG: ribosome small subunit-dependent GTPase A [Bacteroidia bacterium]|jgi:ribosome biogenesis GTPase